MVHVQQIKGGKMTASANTVLVIDDVEEVRRIMEKRLTKEGFVVETAGSGEEGLVELKNNLIDLVLLDLNMPGIDGMTFLEKIHQDKTTSDIPVIMVTAEDNINTAMECMKKGASGYLTKPFGMEQMRQQIQRCLAKPI